MKETNFQRILVTSFRQSGAIVFNTHGHGMQVAGIPDLYVASNIWTGWLELKTGTNKATLLQLRTLRCLTDANVNAYILIESKPRIIVKNCLGGIIGYLPFMSNDLDGIELLNRLKVIMEQVNANV